MMSTPIMLAKGKETNARITSSGDGIRLFNRALELLSNNAPESEHELLELVKKAKREAEKESVHPSKKATSVGRGMGDLSELQAVGHRPMMSPVPADHSGGQQAALSVEGGTANLTNTSIGTTPVALGQTQARLVSIARVGSCRGRVEKPKRKIAH